MFERIVVAIDGSAVSSKTLPVAVEVAKRFGSLVTLVHVREHARYEGSDVDLGPEIAPEDLMEQAVARFTEQAVEALSEIRRVTPGETPEQIVRVADEAHADLIIMGTRGLSELRSMLLGGVANKVVQQAHCPVLLVR